MTKIIISPDNRYLFSTGPDGCLFIFSIGEQSLLADFKSNTLTGAAASLLDDEKMDDIGGVSVVDEALADIVLVKKNEMEEW